MYGVGSSDQYLMEIDTFFQPLGKWKELAVLHHDHEWYIATPYCALIQKRGNHCFLHECQVRGNKFYASRPRVLLSTRLSTLLPRLRSIAHPLHVLTTLPSHNLESNTFHSLAHDKPNISAFHPSYAASLDHVHLHHSASKIYHHLPTFDLQVTVQFFTPLDTKGGL
jgi:hypothetical protein